ncbi:MAG: hypothetical protein AB1607_09135 [Chloroflexota bacterium]
MADEKRPALSETFFLPPLTMVLSFFDQRAQKPGEEQKEADEKMVVKLIEKLSEKEAKD